MNLDMKIHPAVAAVVIALTFVAIGIKVWADGKALAIGGPAQLSRAPSGHVYVTVQDQLLEHTPEGQFARRINLADLGVTTLVGGLAFFPDGDILLRRGRDARSLFDDIRAYRRLENTTSIQSPWPEVGLARCSLERMQCTSFGAPTIDFKATFSAHIDPVAEAIFVSDTSRHALRMFSMDGKEISSLRSGFRFPNQLLLHEGKLFVADTNNHRIAVLEGIGEALPSDISAIDVVPDEADSRGERWPSHFALVGDRWWVNNMRSDMRDGGIYVFDEDWRYIERLKLPDGADPIVILPFESGALISDWDNDRVHYVDASGALLGDFSSSGLRDVLQESAERRAHYRAVSWLIITLFILIIAGFLIKALILPGETCS